MLCYLPGLVKHRVDPRLHLFSRSIIPVTVFYRLTLITVAWCPPVAETRSTFLCMATRLRAEAITICGRPMCVW